MTYALHVEAGLEEGVVQTRHETARLFRVVDRFRSPTGFRINVDDELVKVEGVISVLCGARFD